MMIFSSKIAREERFLANLHGTEYEYYRRHVRRFIPGLRHWHPGRLPSYSTEAAATGLLDSLHCFAALPFALLLQALHASGHLPVVLVLP
ncbi:MULTISPECIES: hypothetical protein [unclassified Phyllobacterium]|uniref:hypothetical protein n=1 Tax=unclassified Phyllobacterium TaxID=2638441 RepID=UPI003012F083